MMELYQYRFLFDRLRFLAMGEFTKLKFLGHEKNPMVLTLPLFDKLEQLWCHYRSG